MAKVYFYLPALSKGGAERVALVLAKAFASRGHKIKIITSYKEKIEYDVPAEIERVTLYELAENAKGIDCIVKLRKIVFSEHPDVLISFLKFRHAVIATLGSRTKCFVSIRNDPTTLYPTAIKKITAKFFISLSSGCIFQTFDALEHMYRKKSKSNIVIFNPIDDTFFNSVYAPMNNTVVTFGRLVDQKRHDLLIKAFKGVVDKNEDARLDIYGTGPNENILNELINNLNLQKNVRLMGSTENVCNILSQSFLFVLSSDFEGMPNALMEAMAVGIPCISTDCPCGGPKTLLGIDSQFLVPINDERALMDTILKLYDNKTLRAKAGSENKKRVSIYSSESIANQWCDFIEARTKVSL